MRKILFRGKRVDNGEWIVSGSIRQWKNGNVGLMTDYGMFKVEPESMSQFTGLTDKNGKNIFEGDIIKAKLMGIYCVPEIAEVDFQRGAFGLKWYVGDTEKFTRLDTDYLPTLEIIGNIHDNPELLEVE